MSQHKYSNLIQINAESIGIKTLDNEILDFLNIEIEEKLKSIISQAKKFMRVSKRKVLKVDDLNHSLRFYNFKPLFGYDSFANAEYERIDVVNGLWRPKQNILDLEDYLSKPIVSCPMQVFPHFHWIAIEGKRPNIPENFIREEIKVITSEPPKESLIASEVTISQPVAQKGPCKVVPHVIHNISKELQIFLENFEQRFRKEIKMSKLSPYPLFSMSKEMEISLNVIENEPGVVELLPYIIEFLMTNLSNKQYIKDPKVHLVILQYVEAILKNAYFYLEPYLHQLVTLILSLILMESSSIHVDFSVNVKDYAIKLLKTIYLKFEIKYPNFIHQLLDVFKSNVLPDKLNPSFLTCYGAIKSVNALGPTHIINIIFPKIDQILDSLTVISSSSMSSGFPTKENLFSEDKNICSSSNLMIIDQPEISSLPKISFSIPPVFNTFPITSSIFSEISSTNVINSNKEKAANTEDTKKVRGRINLNSNKKAFYAYYALKESATLILDYSIDLENKAANNIFDKLTETFGESLLPNLLNSSNISSNVGLDLNL